MAMEDSRLTDFSDDLKTIYQYLSIDNANELISKWHGLTYLRSLWGTTCHYMSFLKRWDLGDKKKIEYDGIRITIGTVMVIPTDG